MKRTNIIFTFLILTNFSLVMAKPNCADLNEKWQDQYHPDFKIKWKLREFNCPSPYARVADTFHYLEKIKFSGEFKPDYYKYIRSGLRGIRYIKVNPHFEWAYASEKSGIITLHEGFVTDDSSLQRVQKLIHEARHVRSRDPGHEICIRGASKGKKACDAKFHIKNLGSGYNYGFKFLEKIKNHSYNHDLSKKSAKRRMKSMLANRFNKITNEQIRMYSK